MTSVVQSGRRHAIGAVGKHCLPAKFVTATDGLPRGAGGLVLPEPTEPGQAPPARDLLSHGMFCVGAMYSYTAAQLAGENRQHSSFPP